MTLQLVLTKNVLGQYKLSTMGLDPVTGLGTTLEVRRGECWYILWQIVKALPKLRAPR